MPGNNRIFVSHTHADNARCEPLLIALDAWRLDYWFDGQQLDAGQELSPRLQEAITQRDVLLRVCTTNTPKSYWMNLERSAFHAQQFQQRQRGKKGSQRTTIDLIFDEGYPATPGEQADASIKVYGRPETVWMADLASALGVKQEGRRHAFTRRDMVGLGAAAIVTVAALGGGAEIAKSRNDLAAKPYPRPQTVPFQFPNPQAPNPHVKWYFATSGSSGAGLAVSGETLIATSDTGTYGLNTHDGATKWWRPAIRGGASSNPIVVGDSVYVGLEGLSGSLYALRVVDGSTIWSIRENSSFQDNSIAIAGNSIVMVTDGNALAAYDTANGAQRWTASGFTAASGLSVVPPVGDATGVYAVDKQGNLKAFNPADGSTRWSFQTGGIIGHPPALASGLVIVGSKDQTLYAINATDGSLKWKYQGGVDNYETSAVSNGTVYVSLSDHIAAVDLTTGAEKWTAAIFDSKSIYDTISGPLGVNGDTIFVPASSYFVAISASARKAIWSLRTGELDFNGTAPVMAGSSAFWASEGGLIYALDFSANA